jgi:transcriptional repressor NrdR
MECPFCHKPTTAVTNSRPSRGNSQIWRRRKCLKCQEIFTTHEMIDLSHILVIKKSGSAERFSRMKLYSGMFYATQPSKIPAREIYVDSLTRTVEKEILSLKKKRVSSEEIAEIVLTFLRKKHTPTFLRFLTNCKDITNEVQLKRELGRYITETVSS